MKKYKRSLFICIAACSLFLGGCSSMHDLTVEEKDLIVHYAAYVVAKHNIQQKDGMSGVYISEEQTSDDQNQQNSETEDAQTPEDGDAVSNDGQELDSNSILMAEAIGHVNDLFITYEGSSISDTYIESNVYLLDAAKGNTFYIMKFAITNPTKEDVLIDHVTKSPAFVLLSEEVNATAKSTLLMTDFTTYYGTIAPGQTVEAVLLFEVPKENAESITDPLLQILIGDQAKNIKL